MITDDFYLNVDLYKRGLFDFISYVDKDTQEVIKLHKKQVKALEYFNDNITTYVGYGGAARGGKSLLISLASLFECYAYPEARYLIGRKDLTVLWQTTWKTLIKTMNNFGFEDRKDYIYNGQKHEMTFLNPGSQIITKNLELKPSDQEASDFGSLEITKGFIDQSEHVNLKIVEKIGERVGTHKAVMYDLKGKLMECFNPAKTHVSSRYWLPFRDKNEKETRKFVRALPTDNPGEEAIKWVQDKEKDFADGTMSVAEYQKQVKGNFDFDDDDTKLCDYDAICDAFTNTHIPEGIRRISADLAMQGRDRFIAALWSGLRCTLAIDQAKSTGRSIELSLRELKDNNAVGNTNIIADADGLGNYLESYIKNIKPFHAVKRAFTKNEYATIKDECAFKLAEVINQRAIYIQCSPQQEERLKQQLSSCLKRDNLGTDGKKKIIGKPKMKEYYGKSPDDLDVLIMGMHFHVGYISPLAV